MLYEPDLPDIIVLIKHKDFYKWYLCDEDLWVMDLHKLSMDIEKYVPSQNQKYQKDNTVYNEREDIEILDESNIDIFMQRIIPYEINYSFLSDIFNGYEYYISSDSQMISPHLFIDFDACELYTCITDSRFHFDYVPKHWRAFQKREISPDIISKAI